MAPAITAMVVEGEETEDRGAEAEPEDGGSSPGADSAPEGAATDGSDAKQRRSGARWWAILGVVMLVEMFVYGRRGEVEVCVGKDGVHDFTLRGQLRDDSNRWKFPRCETRMNLGLQSEFDQSVKDAVKVACRGATLFRNQGEGQPCTRAADGWEHRIESRYVWPWDERFYRHLFWFLG